MHDLGCSIRQEDNRGEAAAAFLGTNIVQSQWFDRRRSRGARAMAIHCRRRGVNTQALQQRRQAEISLMKGDEMLMVN